MRNARRLILSLVAGIGGSVLACSDAALADKRVALVIGNSAYQSVARLPNPVKDATAIGKMFRDVGFDVVEARSDLGILDFKRTIRDFTSQARDADMAVVYYAGHGIEVGGVNYLIPVDAKLATDLDAEDEAIPLDRVIRAIEPARRLHLVILDACRDNPFNNRMQRTVSTRAVSNGLAKVELTLSDTLIAYAAKAGSTADDGNGANSPFTAALLAHIPEPGVDVRIVFGRVRDEVWTRTGHRQEPFVYASLGGDEVPLVPAARKVEPSAPAAESEARQAYELTVKLGTRQAFEAFLKDYKTGLYADLARAEIGKPPAIASTEQPRKPAADAHPAKQPAATAERTDDTSAAPRKPAGPTQTHHRRSVETHHGAPAEHHRRNFLPLSPAISRPAPQAPRC